MSLPKKVKDKTIDFHLRKIAQLKNEFEKKKTAGEKKLWGLQNELDMELQRLQTQISGHEEKIKSLKD